MKDWLLEGGLIGGIKPYLFCDDTWLEPRLMTSNAQDYFGNEYNNIYGYRVHIRDIEEYTAMQAILARHHNIDPSYIYPVSRYYFV